ncbi:PREDICTED: histone acetyltransferase HAC12-like, partial [Camelina sativa]
APRCADTLDNLQPSIKRLKVEQSFQPVVPETENCKRSIVSTTEADLPQDAERKDHKPLKSETVEVKAEIPDVPFQTGFGIKEVKNEAVDNVPKPRLVSEHGLSGDSPKQENIKMEKKPEPKEEDLVDNPE